MKPKKRQKLCHHCDAEVDLDVIVCPFCAADLREEKPEQQRSAAASTVKQLHTGQSQPPYTPTPTYAIRGLPEEASAEIATQPEEAEVQKSPFTAILLSTLGAQALVLALMMLFFGDNGMLLLKWNAKWWPLYLVGAAPLLFFGMRGLKKD
ncbi:MAG TPA: hypothetical protein VGM34_00410 [Chlamydiales bacterium]|jgi:hypothetical protein